MENLVKKKIEKLKIVTIGNVANLKRVLDMIFHHSNSFNLYEAGAHTALGGITVGISSIIYMIVNKKDLYFQAVNKLNSNILDKLYELTSTSNKQELANFLLYKTNEIQDLLNDIDINSLVGQVFANNFAVATASGMIAGFIIYSSLIIFERTKKYIKENKVILDENKDNKI